jgi:LuxR family transcriptional regulator, maltose regulon positive regulatory protein
MYSSLRAVKVALPPMQQKEIQRPRLLAMLDRAIERPITLIGAGPGSGKTVLVNQWARARSHGVVWVSLDAGDDRESRFWTLVQYALQQHGLVAEPPDPEAGLATSETGQSLAERAVDQLAEAASNTDGLLILVLDDVHVLSDPEVVASLDAVLRRPPPQLRVVMTALSDPVLPLHRYRIQGYLAEIRATELALSTPEITQLLEMHDISLSPGETEILAERTEGWIAGVRLSAMRMEGSPDPGRFVTDFAMDRGSIGEYLTEEVLASLPAPVQDVLIRSSICDPITGPLADAICESQGATAILTDLANNNALVMALDHEGARFRCHPLLREVLRHLLNRRPAAVRRCGQENAARWHASEGDLVEALQHAVLAEDWTFCADLLVGGAFEELYLRAASRPVTGIGRFVEATPNAGPEDPSVDSVVAAQAAVAVAIGLHDRARVLLDRLRSSALDGGALALHAVARLLVARQDGDADNLEEAATVLVQHDPQGAFGTFALYERGALHLWQGSDPQADNLLQQALKQAIAESLHAIALRCVGRLAIGQSTLGRLVRSEELLSHGAALLQAHPWIHEEFRVAYHLAGAQVALLHGDLDLYSRFLRLVDAALAPKTDPALSSMQALIQAKALQSAGRYAEARDLLLSTDRRELPDTWVLAIRVKILLFELMAQMGNPHKAIDRLTALARVNEATSSRALLGLVRAKLVAGDAEGASDTIRRIITSQHAPAVPVLIDALLLSAEIADHQGNETAAVEAATTAVQLAAGDRIVLPFIAVDPRIHGLLQRHPALRNLWPAPLDDAAGQWARELPEERKDMHLAEALTEREVSILNWLTTTMTMAEIGTELYVSTNTVKTHVAAIYRKLEVSNRREAIARGRQLHLI